MTTTNVRAAAVRAAYGVVEGGGATQSVVTGVQTPATGYVVSYREWEHKVEKVTGGLAHLIDEIAAYGHRRVNQLTKPGHYLGAWLDSGTLYLDVSEVIADLPSAVRTAVEREQLAIYSLTTGKEIQTSPGRVSTVHAEQAAAWEIMRELGKGSATIDASGSPAFESPIDVSHTTYADGSKVSESHYEGQPMFEVVGAAEYDATSDTLTKPGRPSGNDLNVLLQAAKQAAEGDSNDAEIEALRALAQDALSAAGYPEMAGEL